MARGPSHAAILLRQGLLAADLGQPSRAEAGLRSGLAMRRKLLAADHPQVTDAEGSLGQFLIRQQRLAEAETLLAANHTTLVARFGEADHDDATVTTRSSRGVLRC